MSPEISSNLRKHRRRLGWSQERLAEAAGVSPGAVRKLEQGGVAASKLWRSSRQPWMSTRRRCSRRLPARNPYGTTVPAASSCWISAAICCRPSGSST
ncbi:helix-turn-helix domain-containing protein [Streptomyces sp. NPDC026294]